MVMNEISYKKFVVGLSDLEETYSGKVGAKATNEAELKKAGFTVPDAFVITTDAFQYFLTANQIGPDPEPETVLLASIPESIHEQLLVGASQLGVNTLAVRSSAVSEDLPGASFAGQYETVLNVRGEKELEAAVLRCWASTFNPHVVAYRKKQGISSNGMAVLVQKMVPADAAGVVFSADPVSGDRETVVINSVRGLGDRLVSGEASPDEWKVKNGKVKCLRAPEDVMDVDRARDIAKIAKRIETHFGTPQDIEWALADGEFYILQARPITTLPDEGPEVIPIPIEVPPGFWQHDATRFPSPPSHMFKVAAEVVVPPGTRLMAEEFGLLVDGLEFKIIGGWPYQRMKPLGGKEPPPFQIPTPLLWLLVRIVPTMRARIKKAKEAVRTDKPGCFIHQWYDQWQPEVESEIAKYREINLKILSDTDLLKHFEDVIQFTIRTIKIHALLNTSVFFILFQYVSTCKNLFGWDESQAFDLVSGTSYKSTEPARQLNELARMAKERPAVRKLLEHIDDQTVQRLIKVDREFAETFDVYQRVYGCRTIRTGIKDPTLAERPALSLSLIHDQIIRGYDPAETKNELAQKRSQKIVEARDLLADDTIALARFNRDLERANMAYPVREDNNFYTFSAPFAFFRYVVLEIGSRLADRDVINERDDIFFLYKDEACSALLEGGDLKALVQRHKGEAAWALANPGPPYYGAPPAPPSFDFLPPEAREIMESLVWSYDQMMEYERSKQIQEQGETLAGIAASPGQYTGTVRIIMEEGDFHKIRPGDVMVCPTTSPVWSVLFPSIGALVTDAGGLLSHPAIIAREYRIPAVVATGNATSVLRDGEIVQVDGMVGTVDKLT